jgi:ABC-type amino acid transport substrate-binding protein
LKPARPRAAARCAAAACAAAARAALVGALAACGALAQAQPFTVCMAADNAPLSQVRDGRAQGLDVRIAQAVAAELGRELKVLPFESEYEKESTLAHEVAALLSARLCDAASGFPLIAGDFGAPTRASARPPDHPGAKRRREREFVPLQAMAATRGYQSVVLGAVLRDPARRVDKLADLRAAPALRIGAVSGTLASALAIGWNFGALRPQLVSLTQREDALDALAAGRIDVALVPLALFDGWRIAHPGTPLHAAPWRKPIGINLGFAVLESGDAARRAIDTVIGRALADGTLARWAAEEGVTWTAPVAPDVSGGIGLAALLAD